jgi:hypothetical protein
MSNTPTSFIVVVSFHLLVYLPPALELRSSMRFLRCVPLWHRRLLAA